MQCCGTAHRRRSESSRTQQSKQKDMRESIVFYRSFHEALKELPPRYRDELYPALIEYGLTGVEPEGLSLVAQSVFILCKAVMDSTAKRYDNACKGGAPKGNSNARKQPETTEKQPAAKTKQLKTTEKQPRPEKKQPNEDVNYNEDDNDNVNENISLCSSHAKNAAADAAKERTFISNCDFILNSGDTAEYRTEEPLGSIGSTPVETVQKNSGAGAETLPSERCRAEEATLPSDTIAAESRPPQRAAAEIRRPRRNCRGIARASCGRCADSLAAVQRPVRRRVWRQGRGVCPPAISPWLHSRPDRKTTAGIVWPLRQPDRAGTAGTVCRRITKQTAPKRDSLLCRSAVT